MGLIFGYKKEEFGLASFMEIVVASVNLMAFESSKLDLYNSSYGPFSGTATGCPVFSKATVQIFGTDFLLGKSENLDSYPSRKL